MILGAPSAWWVALRPKTLVIAVAVVLVGTAVSGVVGEIDPLLASVCLLGALLLQIASNFANDLFDFRKGADTEERIGPVRAVAAGLLTQRQMAVGLVLVELAALAVGTYLSLHSSWVILGIGVAGMIAAVLYTAGPFPLGYHGLGDLFVFVFFGLAAVAGTCFVQTGTWDGLALALGVPMGSLGAAVLTVNNIRDLDTDSKVGKRTLPVRLGRPLARVYFALLLCCPYVVVGLLIGRGALEGRAGLCFLSLPLAVHLLHVVRTRTDGPTLNKALAKTAMLLLSFAILLTVGMV